MDNKLFNEDEIGKMVNENAKNPAKASYRLVLRLLSALSCVICFLFAMYYNSTRAELNYYKTANSELRGQNSTLINFLDTCQNSKFRAMQTVYERLLQIRNGNDNNHSSTSKTSGAGND